MTEKEEISVMMQQIADAIVESVVDSEKQPEEE